MPANCYLCGSSQNITRDHIPPEGFFPPDSKQNLITVPCCRKCNDSYKLDDQATRLWLASCRLCSDQAKWIWENKVTKTFQRSAKLKTHLARFVGSKTFNTPSGQIQVPTVANYSGQVDRFLIRICKGMFAYLLPEFDYSKTNFQVMNLLPTPVNRQMLEGILPVLKHEARGGTVFKVWYDVLKERPDTGLFILMFYHGACFVVFFGDAANAPKQ